VVKRRGEFLAIFLDLCAEINTFLIWEGKKELVYRAVFVKWVDMEPKFFNTG